MASSVLLRGVGHFKTPHLAILTEDLVPALWQQLPVELLHEVLSRVPVFVLKTFTRVCKEWKALIESEEFARGYRRKEFTAFCFYAGNGQACLALPNLKANVWEEHFLDFIAEDERWNPVHLVAADGGLLCYKLITADAFSYKINLVVQNPITRKSRRLIVPHYLQTTLSTEVCFDRVLVGLTVDQETGTYKLVVACIDELLSRKTFVYESSSRTWTTSVAASLVLASHYEAENVNWGWEIPKSIYRNGELVWLVKEVIYWYYGLNYNWLVKYSVEKDIWTLAMEQFPTRGDLRLTHNATENRVLLISCRSYRPKFGLPENYFSREVLSSVPDVALMNVEDFVDPLKQAGGKIPAKFKPEQAAFGGGSWFIASQPHFDGDPAGSWVADVFEYSSSRRVVRLPKLYMHRLGIILDTFEATLKAFV